jgi:hypothetical protein
MRSRAMCALMCALLMVIQLPWPGPATAAQYPQPPAVSPFNMTGFIQAMTLDNAADVLSGGTVTVNGTKITIPKNTIVVMSATNLTWQELWAYAPCPWGLPTASNPSPVLFACPNGNGQTGLAMSDKDPATGKVPLTTYEITIMGNRIGNGTADPDYVGAIVYLAQHALNLGQGFINHIDYATGTMHVGGAPGVRNDARDTLVQLNDPAGRFGRVMSPDPRFTADTDNPTIRAKTGYPMCVPRAIPPAAVVPLPSVDGQVPPAETDPLCPQMNRPLDPAKPTMPLGNFTLCTPGAFALGSCRANTPPPPPIGVLNNALATVVANSDATSQAPFQVGDYIEYSGTIQQDDSLGTATGVPGAKYVSAWNVVGNVGIYTSPDAVPAYLAMELTILGTGGTAITGTPPVPEEVTTRIKARGFFTDPTRTVDVFALVLDPCTGAETETLMLGGIPNQKGGVPWGRFRDIDQFGVFPITRQWRARYTPIFTDPGFPGVPPDKVANGLDEMTYTIPVSTFITPENLVYGDPTLLVVPQNFQDWPFLAQGEGPWRGTIVIDPVTGKPANIVGQLTPFPLTNSIPGLTPLPPSSFSCPSNLAPVVKIAKPTQTVAQNTNVTLDASHSTDPSLLALSFLWEQKSGPAVALSNANTATATFRAPNVAANTSLTFQVTVTDSASRSSTGSALVVVTPGRVGGDTVTIPPNGIAYRINRGVLNATATSSDSTCSAILTLTAPGTNLPAGGVLMTAQGIPGPGVPCTYNWTSGKQIAPAPTSVTVTSTLGGSATATVANGELVIK